MVSEHQFYILTIVVIVVIFLIIIMGCCFITKQREHFTSAPTGRAHRPYGAAELSVSHRPYGAVDPKGSVNRRPWMDTNVPPKSAMSFKCYRSLNRPGGPAAGTSLSGVESIKTGRDRIHIEQSFNWFNTQ